MAHITVSAQLVNNGVYSTLIPATEQESVTLAVQQEAMLKKQFASLPNVSVAIQVTLLGDETPEQLAEVAGKLGRSVYGPFTNAKKTRSWFLVGMPKGQARPNTGKLQ